MERRKKTNGAGKKAVEKAQTPTCLSVAAKGITTGADFAAFMSLLMGDLVAGSVTPGVANAACNAGGKLLKVVEMGYKYGNTAGDQKTLKLL